MSQPFALGMTLRDAVSGFTGIATARTDLLSGSVQYGLQPKVKAGETSIPDAIGFDVQILDYVDDGIKDRATPPVETPITLGQTVKDRVTGLVGVTTQKTTYLNGCVRFYLAPPVAQGAERPKEGSYFDQSRLEPVEAAPVLPVPPTRTGGPNTRLSRAMD